MALNNRIDDGGTVAAINDRILQVPKSATLAINEKSRKLQQAGRRIYRLGLGQSPFPVPELMVSRLQAYARAKDYMAVQGYLPLREAIAGFLRRSEGLSCSADDILIGPGSKELLFGLQMALDCELLLPAPSWVSYEPQARLLNKIVHWLPTRPQDGWKLSAEALDAHCLRRAGGRCQLLILNSPNNPSGACYSEAELEALAAVARRHQVIVLSDEIYSELHYEGAHRSIARYCPERTIVSNGISKWAGAGGWRLGFFAFPPGLKHLLQSMVVIASETFTSVSAPIQMASICAFEDSAALIDYIHACRRIMRGIGRSFSHRLRQAGIETVTPEGGFYCLPDFTATADRLQRAGIDSATGLAERLLEDTGVATLPGDDFGLRDSLCLRIAMVDFDGDALLRKTLAQPDLPVTLELPELKRIQQACDRIAGWAQAL
jgi:aspartate/methionine/tyrosine aminotransferase